MMQLARDFPVGHDDDAPGWPVRVLVYRAMDTEPVVVARLPEGQPLTPPGRRLPGPFYALVDAVLAAEHLRPGRLVWVTCEPGPPEKFELVELGGRIGAPVAVVGRTRVPRSAIVGLVGQELPWPAPAAPDDGPGGAVVSVGDPLSQLWTDLGRRDGGTPP